MLFRLSEINKSYGGNEILRGVSFQVNPGEKIGLVGRNGAGKTTVFRLITGEESPDSGNVFKTGNLRIGLLEQHVDFSERETVHTAALSAFQRIHDIESEMRLLELEMAEKVSQEVLDDYAELQTEFERLDGFSYTARAEAILLGLGFEREKWDLPTENLSGGQKNRLGLARLLLSEPDILLLDEPTNHLDVSAVEWLESFLQNYDRSYIIISHDRYFLDRTCQRIIEIENGKAVSYNGNYSRFLIERELRREQQKREFENQQAFIQKTEQFIRKNLAGQKTKQAKSRRNLLERLDRIEAVAPEKGSGNFQIKKVERSGGNVLSVEDLAIGYGEKVLAGDISFTLHRGECLGIIGGNGTGKTTFLKTILGKKRELEGKMIWGTKTETGYYSQELEGLEERNEIINELRRVAPLAENGELRSFLAKFLFFGEEVFKPVSALSGGEKGRLALAKLVYSNVNVLVLDEPTNHLDIPSREALEEALKSYPGTILAVSHDRFFLDQIATQIFSFEGDCKIEIFQGNYSEFHDWKERQEEITRTVPDQNQKKEGENNDQKSSAKSLSKLSKNEIKRMRDRIKQIEEEIPRLEERASNFTLQMSRPEIASNHEDLQKISNEFQTTEKQIQELFEEWDRLSDQLG
ncbi:MAG: ABC-F family ATP-binding cassette domain-containing protein [Pyrinomonadaceae bacterium]